MPKKDTGPDLFSDDAPSLSPRITHAGLKVIVQPQFRLMVQDGDTKPEYAGPRLERGEPLPIERFVFESQGEATKAAARLQLYIDKEHPKTTKKKKV